MPLDPFLAAKIHLIQDVTWARAREDPAVMARLDEFHADPAEPQMPDVVVEHHAIPGPHGPVDIRLYRPRSAIPHAEVPRSAIPHADLPRSAIPHADVPRSEIPHSEAPRSEIRHALVWAHGGGFSGGSLDMPESHLVAAELAVRADALVVSVGYRLVGEGVRYPVPIDDVHAAWRWLTEAEGAGPLPPGTVALGGASAGAALALSAAIRLRDGGRRAPDALLLAYPFVHFPNPALDLETADEMRALPAMLRFTTESIEDMVRNYVGRLSDLPPDAMPGSARLAGLPRTALVLAEYDDLRPSGDLLAKQLGEVDVRVRTYRAAGMLHGHLNRSASLKEVDRSLDFLAESLREE